MTLQKQLSIWFVAFAVLVLFLWLLGDIMLPFIVGLVLAYFLDPVADRMEAWGLPRLAATIIILSFSIIIFVVLILLIAPMLADQVGRFAERLPGVHHNAGNFVQRSRARMAKVGLATR